MVGKFKWKPLALPLPRKIANQKQHRIPGGSAEMSAVKDLKDAGVAGGSYYISLNSSIWPVQNTDGL